MAEGAAVLREALSDAVDRPGRAAASWSAATSAGWTRPPSAAWPPAWRRSVVAYTAASRDPLADDVAWAGRTVAGLGNVEHHVIPAEEMPLVFHGVGPWATGWTSRARPPSTATGGSTIARRAAARGLAAAPDRLRRGRAALRLGRPPARAAADQPEDRPARTCAASRPSTAGRAARCSGSCRTAAPTASGWPGWPSTLTDPSRRWTSRCSTGGFRRGCRRGRPRPRSQAVRARSGPRRRPPSRWGTGGDSTGSWRRMRYRLAHRPPVRPVGRRDRDHPGQPLLRRPGDRGRPGRPAAGAGDPLAVQAADRRGDARHRPRREPGPPDQGQRLR